MDFLDNLVLPQSAHHMVLLKYLLVLTYILLIPYLSVLLGSLGLSLFFERKTDKNENYYRFAKELIDQITFNKSVSFALGVVPLISSAFCYAQLLHLTGLNVSEYILISVLFLIISLILIYTYKYTFHLKDIFTFASRKVGISDPLPVELPSYQIKTSSLHKKSGLYGLLFLIVTIYLFIASIQLAGDSSNWSVKNNLIGLIFSLKAFVYFLQFIVASFALTSALILYKYFRADSVSLDDAEYLNMVKNFSLKLGAVATIILPLLIILNVMVKPQESFSFDVFGYALLALIVVLCIVILFYVMLKESSSKFASLLIYLFVVLFAFLIIKDQYAFDTSTKKQFAILAANYEDYQKKVKEEFGLVTEVINGADIYNGKCIACHQFDRKLVGPPYKEVLPKYDGKKDALVQFVLNPIKVNPEYPPMPNQGLKPKEAEAVVDYLISTYMK
ncbi:MAG: c-type cytochrome [Melioribacteraceae bacterium]|nr:c-type cytochrome [Melioribacteraceae bacterium]